MSTGRNGFGAYLSDDHQAAAQERATKAQDDRDERKREHDNAMAAKRQKREAERQAEADTSHGASALVTGVESGEGGGSPLKTAQRRENNGKGFGRYLAD
nr:hypothetical protein [Rhodococcus sp. (in: high G+C Gram-positive bacteria)]